MAVRAKLGLDDQLTFGRHQGYTVLEILKDRPKYIAWLVDNTDIKFYQSVLDEVDRLLPPVHDTPAYKPKYNFQGGLNYQEDWFDDIPF